MAIKQDHNLHGVSIPGAYNRIDRMIGSYKKELIVQVVTYTDSTHAAALDPLPIMRQYSFPWPTAANAPTPSCDYTAYAYQQLMLLPEFSGGTAV